VQATLAIVWGVARTPDSSNGPMADAPQMLDAQTPERVRVLIVDDSEAVRTGLSLLLNSRSYCEVVGAVDDLAGALEIARSAHPHVALLDFSIPGVDPIALAHHLATCRPRPAVLMLSALANEQSARRANAAGAVGWVLKDAEPDQLFAALLRAARSADPCWEPSADLARDVLADRAEAGPAGIARLADAASGVPSPVDTSMSIDARTVRAVLRALRAEPSGSAAHELAGEAVLSPRAAERILRKLEARTPPLVQGRQHELTGERSYVLTPDGVNELARMERHISVDGAAPEVGRHASCG
jgi:DNA-binding NarL/FixJ family response regulator